MFAGVFVAVGLATQAWWGVFSSPRVVVPISATAAAVMPLVIFNTFRKAMARIRVAETPLPRAVFVSIVGAVVILTAGLTVWAHFASVRREHLVEHKFPGFAISLPQWKIASSDELRYERAGYKLDAPEGYGRSITVRWETGEVPEELLDCMWRDNGMTPGVKESMTVAGHNGWRQSVSSETKHVYLTAWRCPEDQRWLYIMTFLDEPRHNHQQLHESIVSSVRCHTEGRRTPLEPQYADFSPPERWRPTPKDLPNVGFVGPKEELVVLGEGVVGRSGLLGEAIQEGVIRSLMKSGLSLEVISPAQRQTVADSHGHLRTVWSCSGKDAKGVMRQTELMAWHCPQRDVTFTVWYIAEGAHEVSDGVSILLRAECH